MSGQIIHGLNAVSEALKSPDSINRIYFAKESRARGVKALADRAKAAGVRFDFVPQAKLNELAGTREHQGLVAAISPVAYTPLDDVLEKCGEEALLLVTDRVQHARNLGMLIRSALAAGADGLLLASRESALLDETVLRASAGAALRLPVVKIGNVASTLRMLKERGFWIYGLSAEASQTVFEVDWPKRVALVVGNESEGLRPGVQKNCDVFAGIPLHNDVESLNVAVSAAIALFQVAAARKNDA